MHRSPSPAPRERGASAARRVRGFAPQDGRTLGDRGSRDRVLGIEPDQAAGIGPRLERAQIVGGFADADGMDRDAVFLGEGHQYAAASRAVELGHDDPSYADHFAENFGLGVSVLAGRRIEYQQ